jgi:AraC-like DNA-binding protein
MMMDFSLERPTLVRGGNAPTLIELGFWQMGHNVRYRFDFGEGITQPNQVSLASIPMPYEGESLYPCDERIMGISLSITPNVFWGWLTDQPLPQPLQEQLTDATQVALFQQQIPAALKLPLTQLRDVTWQGAMSQLYMEAKVMEIVALYAHHVTAENPSDQPHLTPDDIERLHQAKAMLLSRLDDPPSLSELARAVCLNDHKLKVGFKAVFDTTVFGMLYDHRMAHARDLIESRRYSIAEVALKVGYRSPSAFSAAFKRKYGITPSELQP